MRKKKLAILDTDFKRNYDDKIITKI